MAATDKQQIVIENKTCCCFASAVIFGVFVRCEVWSKFTDLITSSACSSIKECTF